MPMTRERKYGILFLKSKTRSKTRRINMKKLSKKVIAFALAVVMTLTAGAVAPVKKQATERRSLFEFPIPTRKLKKGGK